MKKIISFCISLFSLLPLSAEGLQGDRIPQEEWVVRINSGLAFANRGGTGESAWRSPVDESSCGFQYGVDLLHYHRCLGYGLAFRHYMHGLPVMWNLQGASQDEDVRILYVAPQFSNVEEDFIFKGLVNNLDLGLGYAHYLSDGRIEGTQAYSVPRSGLGAHLNLGFEYRFGSHWGARLGVSMEYYFFKNLHGGRTYPDTPFETRSRLSILLVTTQIGLAWHW